MKKVRIGILTWHYYSNVGSNLQAYAMQKIFDTDFSESEIINYRPLYKKNILGSLLGLLDKWR